MNYRRGLQRVYAVLTIAWIAIVLLSLPPERVKFWVMDHPTAKLVHIDEPKKSISANGKTYILPGDATPAEIQQVVGPGVAWVEVPNGDWQVTAEKNDSKALNEGERPDSHLQKVIFLVELLFLPPALGFAAIFLVIPWIYRGFRGAQI